MYAQWYIFYFHFLILIDDKIFSYLLAICIFSMDKCLLHTYIFKTNKILLKCTNYTYMYIYISFSVEQQQVARS